MKKRKLSHEEIFTEILYLAATKCIFWYEEKDCRRCGVSMVEQMYTQIIGWA